MRVDGAFMKGISALLKETSQNCGPSYHIKIQGEAGSSLRAFTRI